MAKSKDESKVEGVQTPNPAEEEMHWYVVHTYSGFENKVKAHLEQTIISLGLEDTISRVLVPTEPVTESRKGKAMVTQKKFYPGYIMVRMKLNDQTKLLVKNTPKVTGFVGSQTSPVPLTPDEVDRILNQMEKGQAKPKPTTEFKVGDKVRVTDGPFSSFVGEIDEVNLDRSKVKVMVSIFGRQTPVELEFGQIEAVQ